MTVSLVVVSIAAWISGTALAGPHLPLALVYNDFGACKDHCPEAAAHVAELAGLRVKYVTRDGFSPEIFEGASVWIQPGGDAFKVARYLGKRRLEAIRGFIEGGGGYVGFCAGAFLADRFIDDDNQLPGLGIIPWSTAYTGIDSGDAGVPVQVSWLGHLRTLFFNGGATFRIRANQKYPVRILATYPDGKPAAVDTTFGFGRVVLSGPHPEAWDEWKKDAHFEDPDGQDWDLAVDMIHRALHARP